MAITDFNKNKPIEVTSASGEPTISRALCFKIASGDDSTTGTGEIVLDWTNISSQADIAVYDENDNLLDYYFESFDATNETAVIWVYRDWVRDGSTQAKIAYGSGPSDQSVVASTVFDKEANLQAGYLLNESSGDALDVTSNNNDGTVTGATQGEPGIVDGAYYFDGEDDYVDVSSLDSVFESSPFTIVGWAYYDATTESESLVLDHAVTRVSLGAFKATSNWELSIYDGNNRIVADSGIDIKQGWVHLFAKFVGSTLSLRINDGGEVTASGSIVSTYQDTKIGDRSDGSGKGSWPGFIDNLFVYDAGLSADENSAIYAATKFSPDFFSQQAVTVVVVVVVTDSSTNVTGDSATLNGTLEDLQGNSSLDVYFEWGTDTSYGNATATQTISSVPTSFSADISGLTGLETYHYRAVATDGTNYWYGDDVSFLTYDLRDIDETQADFQEGTLTDVEADSGDYLRLADTDVLSFDGTDDYTEITDDAALDLTNEFCIEGWFYCQGDGSGTSNGSVISKWWDGSTRGFDLAVRTSEVSFYWRPSGASSDSKLLASITMDDGWYHVAVRHDGSTAFLYVDGSQKHSLSANSVQTNSAPLRIGSYVHTSLDGYYDGLASDIRLWNIDRTQNEIQDNMNKRLNGDESGLVAYYKLDEGSGDTAYDSAGSNDGTISGASWQYEDGAGNRLSPQLDLSSLGTVDDTLIEWTETLNNQTITIETRVSLDGGSTWTNWATATNGGTIPDLEQGTDISNGILECRQTLSTSDLTVTPELHSLSIYIAETKSFALVFPAVFTSSKFTLSAIEGSFAANYEISMPRIKTASRFTISSNINFGYPHIVNRVQPDELDEVMGIAVGKIAEILNT